MQKNRTKVLLIFDMTKYFDKKKRKNMFFNIFCSFFALNCNKMSLCLHFMSFCQSEGGWQGF